jgi:hypothetical protein
VKKEEEIFKNIFLKCDSTAESGYLAKDPPMSPTENTLDYFLRTSKPSTLNYSHNSKKASKIY